MPLSDAPGWLAPLLSLLAAPLLALALLALAHALLGRLLRLEPAPLLQRVLRDGRISLRVTVVLIALLTALPTAGLPPGLTMLLERLFSMALIAALGWTITRKLAAAFDAKLEEMGDSAGDADLALRRRRTQLIVFRRLVIAAGVVFTLCFLLTSVPAVRAVGLSLFASAGVAGIVAGIAARPAVANLIAGLQIALTQPVRLGDAVTIEGAWGRVQEITSTYITIITWDQRSLVVPLSYFLEKPVTNWTKDSAALLDTVFLYLDHGAPVEAIRRQVLAILAEAEQWDGRTAKVQVTGIRENCIELRVLMSAADATRMFDLRCLVREKLLDFLVREHPAALPRQRQETVAAAVPMLAVND